MNYSSSISVVARKEGIDIKIEYRYTSKATENTLINHNKYILSLDKWKEIYNLNLDRYYLDYKEESRIENDFQ